MQGRDRRGQAGREITANNIAYFGEPAYEYDIAQAIEDGYLAACEIQKGASIWTLPALRMTRPWPATQSMPLPASHSLLAKSTTFTSDTSSR